MAAPAEPTIGKHSALPALAAGVAIWWLFDRTAAALHSTRGESGIVVAGVVLAAILAVHGLLERQAPWRATSRLGLHRPGLRMALSTAAICIALVAYWPVFSWLTGVPIGLRSDATWLSVGLLAQGGIAEEALFRGFVFRRVRQGRSFLRSALIAAVPFVGVHLVLLLTMAPPVAAAALVLAAAIAIPLAWIYERSGGSIWPGSLLHAVIQGAVKVVTIDEPALPMAAVGWMALAATAPWLLILFRRVGK